MYNSRIILSLLHHCGINTNFLEERFLEYLCFHTSGGSILSKSCPLRSKSSITIWSFVDAGIFIHTYMYMFDVKLRNFLNFAVIQPWGSNYIRAAPEGGQCLVAVQLQNFSILLSKLRWGSNYPRTAPEGGQCLVAQRSNII